MHRELLTQVGCMSYTYSDHKLGQPLNNAVHFTLWMEILHTSRTDNPMERCTRTRCSYIRSNKYINRKLVELTYPNTVYDNDKRGVNTSFGYVSTLI